MRVRDVNTSTFELLPSSLDVGQREQDVDGRHHPADGRSGTKEPTEYSISTIKKLSYFIPLAASIAPIAFLIGYSPVLSHQLAKNACTPSGVFTLPFTSSIWDVSRFFELTIAFSSPRNPYSCQVSSGQSSTLLCGGYTFTQVKIIDIAWDVLLGRGGQAVLVVLAYRLFSRVLSMLMEQGEVGYDAFSAVAFNSGSLGCLLTLIRHTVGWTPIPRTRHAVFAYCGMALATLYVVAFPTLVSAMTGYTSRYAPFLNHFEIHNEQVRVRSGLEDCDGIFTPAWGRIQHNFATAFEHATSGAFPIVDDGSILTDYYAGSGYYPGSAWVDYYERYHAIYSQCPSQIDIRDCPAAHIKTWLAIPSLPKDEAYNITLPKPMPGIVPYANTSDTVSKYSHWVCGDSIVATKNLTQYANDIYPYDGTITGMCQAGSGYVWGFSFLMTFLVAVLNLVFVLVMYALWIDVQRHHVLSKDVGEFKAAVTMVTNAQSQYGAKVGDWSARTLQKKVMKGRRGVTYAHASELRSRKLATQGEEELGDPLGGDWGGDVVEEDRI